MLPFKDSVPRERFPLLTAMLVALGLVLWLSSVLHGGLLALLLGLLALAVFGQSVEDDLGLRAFATLCALAAALTYGVELGAGAGKAAPSLAAYGTVAAVLGTYVARRPRGRTLTLVLVPLFAGVFELPALALIAAWLGLQATIGAAPIDEPLASIGAAWFVHLAALPLATLAFLARKRGASPPELPTASGIPPRRQVA